MENFKYQYNVENDPVFREKIEIAYNCPLPEYLLKKSWEETFYKAETNSHCEIHITTSKTTTTTIVFTNNGELLGEIKLALLVDEFLNKCHSRSKFESDTLISSEKASISVKDYWENLMTDILMTETVQPEYKDKKSQFSKSKINQIIYKSEKWKKEVDKKDFHYTTYFYLAWGIFLERYNHKNEAVFGAVYHDSNIINMQDILPLRLKTSKEDTVYQALSLVENLIKENKHYSSIRLNELYTVTNTSELLYDTVLCFRHDKEIDLSTLDFSLHLQLLKQVIYVNSDLELCIRYNSNNYNENLINWILEEIDNIVTSLLKDSSLSIDSIGYSEPIDLVSRKTEILSDSEDTIIDLFKEQVHRFSNKIAVECGNEKLTYRQLDIKSDIIADYLRNNQKISTESLVGVYMERSAYMVVAMLGIMKAGGSYVPIDISFPYERIKKILNNSKLKTIICTSQCISALDKLQWECNYFNTYICIDSDEVKVEEQPTTLMDQNLWGYIAEEATNRIAAGGWYNSYTGDEFSIKEMEEFTENISTKLDPFLTSKTKVLEIGCASGLSMYQIAPKVGSYFGTDLSSSIIEQNKQFITSEGIENITLDCLQAHEIDQLKEKDFDIIILNSVIQYFPGLNYLKDVIKKALSLLSKDGIVFIGDIMDLDLKDELIASMLTFQENNPELKHKIKTDFSNELFLSKNYFNDIQIDMPEIEEIELSQKIYTVENELTKYRYDVLMKINKKKSNYVKRNRFKNQLTLNLKKLDIFINDDAFLLKLSPNNLAYVIYTSGSTGQPKGVMIEHKNLYNFVKGMDNMFKLSPEDVYLAITNLSFDISILELILPITFGSGVVIANDEEQLDSSALYNLIVKHHINMLQSTPSRLQLLMSDPIGKASLNHIKTLLIGGEALPIQLFRTVKESTTAKIYNMYGPTETTVWTSVKCLDASDSKVTLGPPIIHTQFYVMNNKGKIMRPGYPGELFIAGQSLGRGYLNQPELTIKSFTEEYASTFGRLYKTGDWVKQNSNGDLEFIGRIDFQTKIRGYRVELGDIEDKMLTHPEVKEVVVTIQYNVTGENYLCAYYVGSINNHDELRDYLELHLPDYMIPSQFMIMDKIPLTSSGKVNRKLLSTNGKILETETNYASPTNKVEEKLCEIWSKILGKEPIGINDDFFLLGGNSLKAAMLVSHIRQDFNKEIKISKIFQLKTITNIASLIDVSSIKVEKIKAAVSKKYYPISSAQKRIYTLENSLDVKLSYNITGAYFIEGQIDKHRLQRAVNLLVLRHESLRTSFKWYKDELVQSISKEARCVIEFSLINKEQLAKEVKAFVKPFKLNASPLMRVAVFEFDKDRSVIVIDIHHIVADGLSQEILLHELSEIYKGSQLPELQLTYKDFSEWQHANIFDKQEKYWLDKLKDMPVLELPIDYSRPSIQSFEGDRIVLNINKSLTEKLNNLAKGTNSTLFMVLLATYNVLLAKYTGQEDIIVGSIISGRQLTNTESVIGMFANTLALRNKPRGELAFSHLVNEIKVTTLEAFENQDFQFEEIIEKLNLQRDFSRNPVFDTSFVFQDSGDFLNLENTSVTPYKIIQQNTKFELALEAVVENDSVNLNFDYNSRLFNKSTIECMKNHFSNILKIVTQNKDIKLNQIDILTRDEKQVLLNEFNNTYQQYSKNKLIHQLFEEQVERTPTNVAVVYKGEYLTYTDLNNKANRLAHYIRNQGLINDHLVGIVSDRSIQMIVAMLAILKAGGAFLPIDPSYPEERINYLLEDSRLNTIVIQDHLFNRVEFAGKKIMLNDDYLTTSQENLEPIATSNSLAYVIYTSGSTGNPKGVMIEHRSLVNLSEWHKRFYQLTERDRSTKYASFGFDASIWELFPYLISGSSVYIIPEKIRLDVNLLNDFFEANKITITWLPPQVSEQFMDLRNKSLRLLLTGGDKVRSYSTNVSYEVFNTYGPTENTVICTQYKITKDNRKNIPIGKPLDNMQIYILDQDNNLVPLGVKGELCISGIGLSRGYLYREELTNEKFVDNPFIPGEKMYRTGDLARWLPDGNIEYLGRFDHQVKIRGFRIELAEIEVHLISHPDIQKAVVIAKNNELGDKYLCAYLVADKQMSTSSLRAYINKKLPDYMIPAYFLYLDILPLTPNGKLDLKALPDPIQESSSVDDYKAPENEIQEKLVEIWTKVLGVPTIGVDDNFFENGGDSIKALQISANLMKYHLRIDTVDLFNYPRIRELSNYVKKFKNQVSQEVITGKIGLTPAQNHLFESNIKTINHFNQSYMLYRKDGFDFQVVQNVFQKIIEHHDVLRAVFKLSDQRYSSKIREIQNTIFSFEVIEMDKYDTDAITSKAQMIQSSLDITKGPLIRLALFHTVKGDHLLIVIHHLIVDGVSWRIIFEDFSSGYVQGISGQKIDFPSKTDSIKNWTNSLFKYATSPEVISQIPYWNKILSTRTTSLNIKCTRLISKEIGKEKPFLLLSKEKTNELLYQANYAYNTEINDLLLVALGLAVKKITKHELVKIDLEGHGREQLDENINISRTIGWFTSIYPVLINMNNLNLAEQIKRTKEMLRMIPNKGVAFGILKMNKNLEEDGIKSEISFNYLGQFDQDLSSLFQISSISRGLEIDEKENHAHAISIDGLIQDGQLFFECNYDEHKIGHTMAQQLLDSMKMYLEEIIEHCINKEVKEMTPSDFSSKDIEMEDLNNILNLFEE
ncbi:amino acid adenylation domain-containing protein [Paenibacillus sp. KACC 21273]|uniref:non-ribosomal peptide synthetase n=1 Tax=Paenibacillus sp. KACC 21273 TaxID=3025665 RepID=UPI00236737A8|nr:non-ribosomal peptide synthetase [Paenibacillus sp. KACC 21273]WDF52837.1 amino acid adenylation domain-containing protein [Paenibacillus sp. KACC 21273]